VVRQRRDQTALLREAEHGDGVDAAAGDDDLGGAVPIEVGHRERIWVGFRRSAGR
jgi:hypothetical protein